jgi:hypothetical protein
VNDQEEYYMETIRKASEGNTFTGVSQWCGYENAAWSYPDRHVVGAASRPVGLWQLWSWFQEEEEMGWIMETLTLWKLCGWVGVQRLGIKLVLWSHGRRGTDCC